jgi:O-antigen ligase
VVAMVPSVLLAARQVATGLNPDELSSVLETGSTYIVGGSVRLIGASSSGQEFAYTLMALAVATLLLALETSRKSLWIVAAGVTFMQVVSLQRSSLIGTAVAFGIAYVVHLRRSEQRVPKVLAVGASLSCLIVVVALVAPSIGTIDDSDSHLRVAAARAASVGSGGSDFALQERVSRVWPEGLGMAVERPFLGHGPGAVGPVSARFPDAAPRGEFHPDNLLIFILIQFGALGLMVAIWVSARLAFCYGRPTLSLVPLAALFAAGMFGSYIALTPGTVAVGLLMGSAARRFTRGPTLRTGES